MTTLQVRIDHELRFRAQDAPDGLLKQVLGELTIRNPSKDRAVSELVRGADQILDYVPLSQREGDFLILPRGFVHRFDQLAREFGAEIEWDNRMILLPQAEHLFRNWKPASLRGYQIPMRDAMIDMAQGCISAATGVGKTRSCLEFVRWAGQKTLVIVNKTSLARQWETAAKDLYGYECGFIGEGSWSEKDLTVATWQSIHRAEDFDFAQWGCVIADEVHRTSGLSWQKIMGQFPAYYRIGLSATPQWSAELWPIVSSTIGPVIYQVPLRAVENVLEEPQIRIVPTDFDGEYQPTRREGRKRVQNNYAELTKTLAADFRRNNLIADIARKEAQQDHHVLIVTSRIEHVKQLVKRLEKDLPLGKRLHVLTGRQNGADAERVRKSIETAKNGTVLVSTTATEGTDLPRIDRIILSFPIRHTPLIEQIVGRGMRKFDGKDSVIVYDLIDPRVGVFKNQARERQKLYMRKGWTIDYERPQSKRSA